MRLPSCSIWVLAVALGACSDSDDTVGTGDGTSVGTGGTEESGEGAAETGLTGADSTTTMTDPVGETSSEGGDDSETSSGPALCDDLDVCGACRSCATEADCADEHGACHGDEACAQLVECVEDCRADGLGDACEDACIANNPGGQALVLALHQCLVTACPNSCG